MNLPRSVLWLTALAFVGFGLAFTVSPVAMANVIGIELSTPAARIDFAATYGGFELGFGAFLIACAARGDWLRVGLWASVAALAGFAVIRLLTLALTPGDPGGIIYFAVALEVSGTLANAWAVRQVRRQMHAQHV